MRRDTAGSSMELLTSCHVNRTRFEVRTVRRDTAEPSMELLTICQANKTRFGVGSVSRDTAGPGMEKSLTVSCQVNGMR